MIFFERPKKINEKHVSQSPPGPQSENSILFHPIGINNTLHAKLRVVSPYIFSPVHIIRHKSPNPPLHPPNPPFRKPRILEDRWVDYSGKERAMSVLCISRLLTKSKGGAWDFDFRIHEDKREGGGMYVSMYCTDRK